MIRWRSHLAAVAAGLVAMFALVAVPAAARADTPLDLPASVTVAAAGPTTVSEVRWELPAGAGPGDTVVLRLPEHAGGSGAQTPWVAASGVSVGEARLADDGTLVIELTDAAADPANRQGVMVVTSTLTETPPVSRTSRSEAGAVLQPGERPGPFFGIPDRDRGNKYGAWTDDTETRARWVLETPRGPWDTMDVVDRVSPGHRVDCAAGISVRATSDVDPVTGYLRDLVDVPAERVSISCAEDLLSVRIAPVGDEIVEVALVTVADTPSTALANTAAFEGSIVEPATSTRTVGFEPLLSVPPTPDPPVTEPPVPDPPRPEVPVTPPPVEPTPVPSPTPNPRVPTRLAATGGDEPHIVLLLVSATLVAVGAGSVVARGIRRRARA